MGAFKLALEEKFDLLPLVISGTREAIPKHSWRIERRSIFRLKILDPISVSGKEINELEVIRDEIRRRIVREFERLR